MLRNDTIVEVCRENHRDFVYVFTPWWRYHHDVADGTDLLLLVKLIPGFYPLCLGHCISNFPYVGTVAEYKISLLLLLTVGFGDLFLFLHSANHSFPWYQSLVLVPQMLMLENLVVKMMASEREESTSCLVSLAMTCSGTFHLSELLLFQVTLFACLTQQQWQSVWAGRKTREHENEVRMVGKR